MKFGSKGKPNQSTLCQPSSRCLGFLTWIDAYANAPVTVTAQGHGEAATATSGLQIAVMIRSDVFRNARARSIDSTPGPPEFSRVVNWVVAQHLAESPVHFPDLAAVLVEASEAD